MPRVFCHEKASFCHNRVFPRVGYSCCDRVFDVAKELAKVGESMSRQSQSMS